MIGVTVMRQAAGRRIGMTLGIAILALGIPGAHSRGDETRLADYFGFLPLEIYKLDTRLNNLMLRDLDGDKINDIIVVNNGRSRIDILLSGKKPGGEAVGTETGARREKADPNEIAS